MEDVRISMNALLLIDAVFMRNVSILLEASDAKKREVSVLSVTRLIKKLDFVMISMSVLIQL